MKRVLIGIAVAFTAGAAQAEHKGPIGDFPGQKPEEVSAKIAAVCEAGGFAVRRYSPTDLACQGGDFAGGTSEFRNGGKVDDPASRPQAYHRFVVDASPTGATVHERSQVVMTIGPTSLLNVMEAKGVTAMKFNARVRSLYTAVAAMPGTPSGPAAPPAAPLRQVPAAEAKPISAAVPASPDGQRRVVPKAAQRGCIRVLTDPSQSSC